MVFPLLSNSHSTLMESTILKTIVRIQGTNKNKVARQTSERYWRASRIINKRNAGRVSLKCHLSLFWQFDFERVAQVV